jgi:hypothetical protein
MRFTRGTNSAKWTSYFGADPNYGDLYQNSAAAPQFPKRPARRWYWVPSSPVGSRYPNGFSGGLYGDLILSILNTFKLKCAYITNLIKCGLNSPDGNNYRGIDSYQPSCVNRCYRQYLEREIGLVGPKIIFTFGSAVTRHLRGLLRNDQASLLQQLPHPAGRRRGFSDEYYRVLYFWLVLRRLVRCRIVDEHRTRELAELFLESYVDSGR